MSGFRPRISLLSALLVMTIVGMGIVIVQLWREVGPLREEVRELRTEVGMLVVDDETKIHVVRVDTRDKLTWRWRVWLPKSTTAQVHISQKTSPPVVASSSGSSRLDQPGENVIEFRIDRDRRNDLWRGTLRTANSSIGNYDQPWVEWPFKSIASSGVGFQTRSFDRDKRERIDLAVYQVTDGSNDKRASAKPQVSGFAIWLEPIPDAASAAPAANAP